MEAALAARISSLEDVILRLEGLVRTLVDREPQQEFYGVDDLARIVDRSSYQIREWLKAGRLLGEKWASGRGRSKEWMVSNEGNRSHPGRDERGRLGA